MYNIDVKLNQKQHYTLSSNACFLMFLICIFNLIFELELEVPLKQF